MNYRLFPATNQSIKQTVSSLVAAFNTWAIPIDPEPLALLNRLDQMGRATPTNFVSKQWSEKLNQSELLALNALKSKDDRVRYARYLFKGTIFMGEDDECMLSPMLMTTPGKLCPPHWR